MSRGRSRRTLSLLDAAYEILAIVQPCTVRAVCYRLFVAGLIPSMQKVETNRISRLLTIAREEGAIPWTWIVDETRSAERCQSWDSPKDFARSVIAAHRRDYWTQQPVRVEVWSEKGTVRGTLQPVLHAYGVTFRVMHGYGSATAIREIADESASGDKPLRAYYVGDFDASGMHMSEVDLPRRLDEYGASLDLVRLAITEADAANSGLPHFAAADKRGDPRHAWFVRRHGHRCIELDALDPNELRDRVERAILAEIDPVAWARCKTVEEAEHRSLIEVMANWGRNMAGAAP